MQPLLARDAAEIAVVGRLDARLPELVVQVVALAERASSCACVIEPT